MEELMKLQSDFNYCSKREKRRQRELEKCLQRRKLLWDLAIECIKKEILDQILSKNILDNSQRLNLETKSCLTSHAILKKLC